MRHRARRDDQRSPPPPQPFLPRERTRSRSAPPCRRRRHASSTPNGEAPSPPSCAAAPTDNSQPFLPATSTPDSPTTLARSHHSVVERSTSILSTPRLH